MDGNETWLTRLFAASLGMPWTSVATVGRIRLLVTAMIALIALIVAGDGAPIERGNSARERIDKAVQLGVWERPVDVSVPFRGVAGSTRPQSRL